MKMSKSRSWRPQQRTELDKIVTQLRAILRRETSDVVLAGNLLRKARKLFADEHGDWLPWLKENFDLSIRTAQRYIAAAEYVEIRHVSHFTNLSPTVLYGLAGGHYSEQEEAAILAAARKGRVDQDAADTICEKLAPANDDVADDADDGDDDTADPTEEAPDPEAEAVLDGPRPAGRPRPSKSPDPAAVAEAAWDIGAFLNNVAGSPGEIARKQARLEELENVARRLEAENVELRAEVEDQRSENADLREALEQGSKEFTERSNEYYALRAEVEDLRSENAGLREALDRMGQPALPPADGGLDITASLRRAAPAPATERGSG